MKFSEWRKEYEAEVVVSKPLCGIKFLKTPVK